MDIHFSDPLRDVFIFDLARSDDDEVLFRLASRFAVVLYARVVRDRETGAPRGFGFCRFATPVDATKGREGLDGLKRPHGRTLSARAVRPGKPLLSPARREFTKAKEEET